MSNSSDKFVVLPYRGEVEITEHIFGYNNKRESIAKDSYCGKLDFEEVIPPVEWERRFCFDDDDLGDLLGAYSLCSSCLKKLHIKLQNSNRSL